MKKKRFTEEQIIGAIKRHESGIKVEELCREMGISNGTFYKLTPPDSAGLNT